MGETWAGKRGCGVTNRQFASQACSPRKISRFDRCAGTSLPIAQRLESEGKPFIILSGNDMFHLRERCPNYMVMTKPINYEQLIDRVKEVRGA
jgi:hypothetical protein